MITKKQAENILQMLSESKRVLLHCHVNPDGDSYGSALAMMQILENMGKTVTVIGGDSLKIEAFGKMPGFEKIVDKNFGEVNLADFDTFVILDTSSLDQISRKSVVNFPVNLNTINVDHHQSNKGFCKISLIDVDYSSCAEMVYDLAKYWGVPINVGIATDMFIGIYTDTGGFRYLPSNFETINKAAELAKISKGLYQEVIYYMDNNNQPEKLKLLGVALGNLETYFGDKVWISAISQKEMLEKNLPSYTDKPDLANMLKSIKGVMLGISFLEMEMGKISLSIRTKDAEKYDVSKLAVALGGGGHKAAAGATMVGMGFKEAKKKLLKTISEIYPDLLN